jgi:hypothetical protein
VVTPADPESEPVDPSPTAPRSRNEALAAGIAGAALGGATLTPVGLTPVGALVGGANGAISGWRQIYDWRRPTGVAAFVLDSTWGLIGTAIGVSVHAAQRGRRDAGYHDELSRRQGHHVYAGGVRLKRGFAVTWGNVISNAAGTRGLDPSTAAGQSRRALIRRHESLHVWQNRIFGPLYPALYAGWFVAGATVGLVAGLSRGRDVYRAIETLAYYDNPFEVWAYRRDGKWPPRGADESLAWGARRRRAATRA